MASPMIFGESSAVSPAGSCRSLPTPQRLFTSLNALAVPRPAGACAAPEEDETEPTPQIKTSRSASETEQSPKPPLLDLDSPYLPLLASSLQHGYMSDIGGIYSGGRSNELVCRFRAAHRPPYMKNLSDPLDFASYGEVVTNTPDHLHLRVRFEHLHMVHIIKQAWVERHLRPDDTCVLRLSDPVLNASVQSLDLTKTEPEDLLDALMPRQDHTGGVGDVVVGQHSTAAASPGPDHLSASHADTPSTSVKPSIDKGTQASLPSRTNTADASTQTEEQMCPMTIGSTPVVVPAGETRALVPTTVEAEMTEEPQGTANAAEALVASRLARLSPKKVKSWADIARRT